MRCAGVCRAVRSSCNNRAGMSGNNAAVWSNNATVRRRMSRFHRGGSVRCGACPNRAVSHRHDRRAGMPNRCARPSSTERRPTSHRERRNRCFVSERRHRGSNWRGSYWRFHHCGRRCSLWDSASDSAVEAMVSPAMRVAPIGPRSHADEYAVVKIIRPVESTRRTGIRSVAVVAILTRWLIPNAVAGCNIIGCLRSGRCEQAKPDSRAK